MGATPHKLMLHINFLSEVAGGGGLRKFTGTTAAYGSYPYEVVRDNGKVSSASTHGAHKRFNQCNAGRIDIQYEMQRYDLWSWISLNSLVLPSG
jgi:hypothetical protein